MHLSGPNRKKSPVSKLLLEDIYDFLNLSRVAQFVIADGAEPVIEVQVAEKGVLVAVGSEVLAGVPGDIVREQGQSPLAEGLVAGERLHFVQHESGIERNGSLAFQLAELSQPWREVNALPKRKLDWRGAEHSPDPAHDGLLHHFHVR